MASTLIESVYDLAGELRALGPAAHERPTDARGPSLVERLAAVRAAIGALRSDLFARRSSVLARQLAALGIDEGSTELKVHLGCGGHELPGWINVDNYPAPLAISLDWGLPLPNHSARYVFSAHLLEHLFYPAQSGHLLAEIRRVLMPGGVVRLVVPDIERCLTAYSQDDREFFAARQRHFDWLPDDATNLESFLAYAGAGPTPQHLFEGHKFGYDFATLARCLERAGFSSVRRCSYQASPHAALRVDDASHNTSAGHRGEHFSLFVEAQA
jgi:SAM-dependent methyltransferase